jgi:hypothetical protein
VANLRSALAPLPLGTLAQSVLLLPVTALSMPVHRVEQAVRSASSAVMRPLVVLCPSQQVLVRPASAASWV